MYSLCCCTLPPHKCTPYQAHLLSGGLAGALSGAGRRLTGALGGTGGGVASRLGSAGGGLLQKQVGSVSVMTACEYSARCSYCYISQSAAPDTECACHNFVLVSKDAALHSSTQAHLGGGRGVGSLLLRGGGGVRGNLGGGLSRLACSSNWQGCRQGQTSGGSNIDKASGGSAVPGNVGGRLACRQQLASSSKEYTSHEGRERGLRPPTHAQLVMRLHQVHSSLPGSLHTHPAVQRPSNVLPTWLAPTGFAGGALGHRLLGSDAHLFLGGLQMRV